LKEQSCGLYRLVREVRHDRGMPLRPDATTLVAVLSGAVLGALVTRLALVAGSTAILGLHLSEVGAVLGFGLWVLAQNGRTAD